MSSSVFKESPILPNENYSENLQCNDNNDDIIRKTTETKNLVVVYGKNGLSVDKKVLEDLMDDRIVSTLSVIRLHSPTPANAKDDNNKKSKKGNNSNNNNDENDDSLTANEEDSSEKKNDENDNREVVDVTIEEFYPPEEAKQLAKEILNCAGISSPLEIRTDLLEFRRFVIQNDHCYTPLTSPSQVKSTTAATSTSATISSANSEISTRPTLNRSLNRGSTTITSTAKKTAITNEKQAAFAPKVEVSPKSGAGIDTNQSEAEEEEDYSDYTETSSSESDNDRDSDLDFDLNDRAGRRRKASAKRKSKTGKKLTNRRKTLNLEKDDEEKKSPYSSRLSRQSVDSRKSLSTVTATTPVNSLNAPLQPKIPLKVHLGNKNQQTKTIHIISKHPTSESEMQKGTPSTVEQLSKSITTPESNKSLSRVSNPPVPIPKRKSEGVFTEISTFLKQGETSKPNLRVTQLKSVESNQTDSAKGFMPLGVEAAVKNQLPAQISIQTHQSSSELAAENDKQLDLIDSIVKDEMRNKNSIIVKDTMNENIPHLVKMLEETTEKAILAKSKGLSSSTATTTIATTSGSSSFTHSVEDIDIASAPLLETPEDDIPEDLFQHVVELMENKNIQEVIDKEMLNVHQPTIPTTQLTATTTLQQQQAMETSIHQSSLEQSNISLSNTSITDIRNIPKKEPIEIVRKDGRVIKLPPIEAPTTRAKRRAQTQGGVSNTVATTSKETTNPVSSLKQQVNTVKAQSSNSRRNSAANEQKTANTKKRGSVSSSTQSSSKDNVDEEESDSEDDPNKLWCICRQPHNNRFMICCDACEDWFHGTCVNITKAMGLEMELKGVEWRCPNCMRKENPETKKAIQSKINEFMGIKKTESNTAQQQQQQSDDTKKSNDSNKRVQSQSTPTAVGGAKKTEQIKNRRKSVAVEQKKINDNLKSPSVIDTSQKKITEIFKRASPFQKKSDSVTSSANNSIVTDDVTVQKTSEHKPITIQKKISSDSNRLSKDVQKKIQNQQSQDNSSCSDDINTSDGHSRATKSKVNEKNEKLINKSEQSKVTTTIASTTTTTKDITLMSCVVCKKPVRPNSIYCSDDCIRKHANNSRLIVTKASKAAAAASTSVEDDKKKKTPSSFEEALAKASETTLKIKNKIERVCVFERKTGRILCGAEAPTIANLKKWLQDNPTFEVVQPGSPQALSIERKRQQQRNALQTANTPTTPTTVEKSATKPNVAISTTPPTPTTPATPATISPASSSTKGRIMQIEMQPLSSSGSKVRKTIQIIPIAKPSTATSSTTTIELKTKDQNKVDSSENRKSKDKEDKETMKESAKDKKEEAREKETKIVKSIKKQSSVEQPKESQSTSSGDGEPIRLMVKKTVKEQLMNRMNEIKDPGALKLTEAEVEEFANETEAEMYKLFNSDVGTKYKTKYRSLMFNIKDRKNETLFQKICNKIIEPKQLVRMSPEEMASQELAQWRQNENKHQLEMIKKSELDLLSCKKNYVLKTHKGEEVIESKSSDQVSLDLTIPVEDVVTVLNSSAVSSTTSEIIGGEEQMSPSIHEKGKDFNNSKVSSSYEVLPQDTMTVSQQESETKEKKKIHIHTSSSSSSSRDKDRDRDRDRHYRPKEKHRHKKRSRSRSRSRDRKHRSPGREEKRNRNEKEKDHRAGEGLKKERYENKEKSDIKEKSSKDRHHESSIKDKASTTTTLTVEKHSYESKSKQSTKQPSLNSSNSNNNSISQSTSKTVDKDLKPSTKVNIIGKPTEEYNLIDKILESTKTVEEAANLIGVGDDIFKEKEKEKEKKKEKEKEKDKSLLIASTTPITATTITTTTNTGTTKTLSTYSSSTISKSKFNESSTNSAQDSDQEPSSTVTIATPPEDQYVKYSSDISSILWNGSINMIDVATFQIIIQPVSGIYHELDKELPLELDVVGRISPDTVWEYIMKIKKSPNKEIVIVRLVPSCETENLAYTALYSYLDKRKRLGVVKTTSPNLKDFYILPLGSRKMLPQILKSSMIKNLEFYDDDTRPDLLMGIIIRIMGKRLPVPSLQSSTSSSRGFHPPTKIRKTDTSVITSHIPSLDEDNFTPPNSPKRKLIESSSSKNILTAGHLPQPQITTDSIDLESIIPPMKLNKSYNQDDEPYSPGGSSDDDNIGTATLKSTSSTTDTTPDDLKRKMDEINRQIEAQKMEIAGMLNMEQGKSYSTLPSVDLTPALANISIPSNLHQILASIKQTQSSPVSQSSSSTSSVIDPKITLSSSSPLSHITTSSSSSSSSSSTTAAASSRIPSMVPPPSSTFSTTTSGTSGIPPLIGSLLNTDEEYVPGPIASKINLNEMKDLTSVEKSSSDLSASTTSAVTETFTHDVDLRVEYPQLSKKPRWDMISNPPPPGLEDEFS